VFTEGEAARGVYILRTGRAIVSISSSGGRIVILRVARPCDLLGLNSTLRKCPYDTTAKALEPCRVDFISRAELLTLIERSRKGVVQYLVLVKAYGNVAKLDCRGLDIII
jgi:CRP/FNR family transcriptional regulator